MLFFVVIIVLAAAFFAAYGLGVRKGKQWGTIVMVVCLVALLGTLGHRLLGAGGQPGGRARADRYAAETESAVAGAVGAALRETVSEPAVIAVVLNEEPGRQREAVIEAWRAGLGGALGDNVREMEVSFSGGEVAPSSLPAVRNADIVIFGNGTIAPWLESLAGKPRAACFRASADPGARATAQDLLDRGLLEAAVFEAADGSLETLSAAQ